MEAPCAVTRRSRLQAEARPADERPQLHVTPARCATVSVVVFRCGLPFLSFSAALMATEPRFGGAFRVSARLAPCNR